MDASQGTGSFVAVPITKEGKTIFRGSASVVNDSFAIKVNIPYDIQADSGKIRLYSKGEKESYLTSKIYLVEGSLPDDTTPPTTELRLQDRLLERGDLIPPSGKMTLIVRDSSGLDLRKKTNIEVIVNDMDEYFLADRFTYTTGSSTTGEVDFDYESPGLTDSIKFNVYAKDNAGNIAVDTVYFKIGDEELLWDVKNYPNPMSDKTVIIYHLSEDVPVRLTYSQLREDW